MGMQTFILLFQCQDQKGIVFKVSDCILRHGGNIITADQYTIGSKAGYFFMRVEFVVEDGLPDKTALEKDFSVIAQELLAQWHLYDKHNILRMGIFVSRLDHCLADLLYLWKSGDLQVKIPFVASNFEGNRPLLEQYNIPFYFIPATKEDTKEAELLKIAQDSDFLVLARYMQVLSPKFLQGYAKDIINIHHGFLPFFKGAHPYQQALASGVKVIAATAHFITERLDDGPIITQDVEEVSHRDDLAALVRKGKNLEKRALFEAVHKYIDYRVIKYNNKTIVF